MPELPVHTEPGFATEYRGWKIWKFTGWKGYRHTAIRSGECRICGLRFEQGDALCRNQMIEDAHWKCEKGSDDAPNYVFAQWLAEKDGEYICSTYPGDQVKFKRGDSFDVSVKEDQVAVTDSEQDSPARDLGKHQAFNALLRFIDKQENTQEHED